MTLIFIAILGGLGLFIAGMNMMSRGIERVAGARLRKILENCTKNRFVGLLVGLFFTAVIQSSSAATAMTVSFVNAGLMKLSEACGIILGANIGTTVTSLLVALRLSTIAPLFVLCGAIMVNFIKKPIIRKSGEIVLGFGILFVGISTMSAAMGELRDMPSVINALSGFNNPILAVLLGLIITSVVQSSSVTVSILVVMGSQGLVDLRICMFVILGCNIGACTSALLAAIGGTKNGKRTALIHLLFNVFGTILMYILLLICPVTIEEVVRFFSGHGTDPGTLGRNIAVAHLLFKVFQVIVLYPFMNLVIKLTYVIVKGDDPVDVMEKPHVKYIQGHGLPNREVAIPNAFKEIERMANMAIENINDGMDALLNEDTEKAKLVYQKEEYIDYLNAEISSYLVRANQNTLPLNDAKIISALFHVINDIERIGDHAENFVDFIPMLGQTKKRFSPESVSELNEMMKLVNKILSESLDMFITGNETNMEDIKEIEEQIDVMHEQLQETHIKRLAEGKCNAQTGVYFSDIISGLERVGDHAINIAFAVTEAREAN